MHVNNLVVPVVLWGKFAPTHSISCIYLSKDHKTLVTGTEDGQLCVWIFNHETNKIIPKCLMVGHSASVNCITSASNVHDNLIVTSTEDGELCLWDTIDGKCREVNKLSYIHTNIQSYQMFNCEDIRLFCNGKYPDVVIIDPISLDVLFVLTPRVCSNWISAVHILRPARLTDDVVLGITVSGNIKVWTLVGDESNATEPIYENEHKQLQCLDPLSLKCCSTNPRMLLIVSSKCWQIYDVSTFSLISSAIAPRSERWISGNFIAEDRILVWSNRGKGYLFKLLVNINSSDYSETSSDSPFIYCILSEFEEKLLPGLPAMTFTEITKQNKKYQYFVRGDFRGKVILWTIPEVSNSQLDQIKEETVIKPAYSQFSVCNSFDDVWSQLLPGPVCILDRFRKSSPNNPPVKLTASLYVRELGRLIIGRKDGLIVCCSASEVAIFQLLRENSKFKRETPKVHLLRGHSARVNCFMHPHSAHKRYDESHLLSGSIDASICLWNLFTGILLCKFTVHSGEIMQFLVPPENCTAKTLECVCVVSSDNSVSMINLDEKKCVFLASRHRYPVVEIKWRPFEDFLLIFCSDKSLSIWQIETGHLDRVLKGTEAEEIMKTCEQVINNQTMLEMGLANPAVHFFRGLKNRNFSAIKHATQRGLQQLQQLNANQHQEILVQAKSEASALIVQGLKANRVDSEVQVLFFDIEAIIVELLNEEFVSTKNEKQHRGSSAAVPDIDYQKIENLTKSSSPDAHRKITDFLGKVKSKAEDMEKKFKDKDKHGLFSKMKDGVEQFQTKAESLLKQTSQDQSNENRQSKTTRVPMVDLEPNRVMETTLIVLSLLHSWGIDKDLDEICENSISLLRPKTSVSFGIVSRTGYMSFFLPSWPMANSETIDTNTVAVSSSNYEKEEEERANLFTSRIHWELSSTLTTNHLSTMIALSNTLRSLNDASFLHDRRIASRLSAIENSQNSNINDESSINNDTQIKQAWSLLSTLHCVLLPDKAHSNLNFKTFKSPQVEILTRRWQHPCIEIREATQSLLLAELNRIGLKGRKTLLDSWSQYLPSYTHLEHSSIKLHPSASKSSINSTGSRRSNQKEHSDYEYDEENEEIRKPCSLSELKRKQTTAVILLGIIGAKFHEEFFPNESTTSNATKTTGSCRRSNASSSTLDCTGFGLDNNLTRLTAIALSHLLLAPSTPKLPLHTPLRRAAIDLIGRGFHIWEPYLDVSKVLLGLLELCFDFCKIVPFLNCGLPLTAYADSCRTAKNAVNLIANIRPAVFITTMAREIARYNSIQQSSQSSNINASNSVLYKSKTEILHVIEMLIERSQNDIVKLLVETVEIILHCIESSHLKTKSLLDLFPAISKFNQISHCCAIRRIVVGASNGNLVLYDLKQNKSQSIRAHSNAINAAAFSPCGKYMATYSCGENRLGFWQTTSGIFGIGSSHTRCIKTNSTTPFPDASKYPSHKISKLLWINNKTVALLFPNGVESRFQI